MYTLLSINYRQQTKHLGINGAQQIAGIAVSAGRNRRQHEVGTHAPETTTPQGKMKNFQKLSQSKNKNQK